ncbi:hypothetical protein TTRE_0000878801 [Trichuris trichiura]|uniref:Uncharacterized protein n=1 Tax=Trichuris trichiura TaxID=36087 RepID=A0A077ZKZ2_TRITR|nr:hypothetical protein TTRE_0000878801 [Trichuris trichiura]
MLLLFLLGAFTHLLSAVPISQNEVLTRELDAGPYSSTLAKRSLDITSEAGYEQHTDLEHGHLVRLRGAEEPGALLPVSPEQHQQRFKRGIGKKLKKKWRSVKKGVSKLAKNVKKVLPKKPIPIINYTRRF